MADGIPDYIEQELVLTPAEDVVLHLLRDRLHGISVQTLIRPGQTFPFTLLRRDPQFGSWSGDPRFIDSARLAIHNFVSGPNGDQEAGNLSHFVFQVLHEEARKRRVIPGLGYLLSARLHSAPRRVADWATAEGPVQYAELPSEALRNEVVIDVSVRRLKR